MTDDFDIRDLTREMQRSKEAAWKWFHDAYYDLLLGVVKSRGVQEAEAADVVQQVYLKILRKLKLFDCESDLRAWVCCVARSVAIDHLRKRTRQGSLLQRFWEASRARSQALSHGDLLEGMELHEKRLLERHYAEGWTQAELAAEAGISVKAMESRLARLRRRAKIWLMGLRETR